MNDVITWLSGTSLSATLTTHLWVVPAVQSLHIIAIAVLTASVVFVDMRLLRLPASGAVTEGPISAVIRRFAPWTYGAVAALLLTGLLLVIAEPGRELGNPLFWTKMGLVVLVVAATAVFQGIVRRNASEWDHGSHRSGARAFAIGTLAIWLAIIACGRWIAYIEVQ